MASKEIKFNLRLAIDGKEQLVSAVTTTRQLKGVLSGAKDEADKMHQEVFKLNQAFSVWNNIKEASNGLNAALSSLAGSFQNVEVANQRLKTVMEERMKASSADIAAVQATIKAQTQLGILGGSVQKAGAQQVATFLTQRDALVTLIPAINDLVAQQKGLAATEQDAQNIGNLFGKVMQGQTSALKRVGITFTEAQERVLKMGTEQERAAMLAEVVTNNVGHMNAALGDTAAGAMKQFQNKLAGIKVKMGEVANQVQPYLSMASSFVVLASSAHKALLAIVAFGKAVGVTKALTLSIKQMRIAYIGLRATMNLCTAAVRVSRAQNISLAASFRTVAVASTTAKMAVRGFMASTVIGVAIAALGFAIEKLVNYFDSSTKSVKDNTEALNDNAEATTQADKIKSAVQNVQEEAATHYADEISKVRTLTAVIHDSNAIYADRMAAIKKLQSIVPGYQAQIQKDGTIFERNAAAVEKYIQKLQDLAMAEAAFDEVKKVYTNIIKLRIEKQKYEKQANDVDTELRRTHNGQGANELRNPVTLARQNVERPAAAADAVKQNGSLNFNYVRDTQKNQQAANAETANTLNKVTAYNMATGLAAKKGEEIKEQEDLVSAIFGSLTTSQKRNYNHIAANGGYGKGQPTLAKPNTSGGTGHPHASTPTPTTPTYDEKSLEWYDKEISKQKELAQSTNNLDAAKKAMAEATRLEGERKELAVKVGIEKPDAPEVKTALEALQDQLRAAQTDFDNAVTVEAKVAAMTKVDALQAQINEATNGRLTIEAEVEPQYTQRGSVGDKRKSYANAQAKTSRIKNDYDIGLISKEEAQKQVDDINKVLSSLKLKPITVDFDTKSVEKGTGKMREGAQSIQQLGSSIAQLGSQVQAPALNIAGVIAQSIATMVLGYAEASKDASKLTPFGWIAFAATGLATLLTMIASVKSATSGSYAHGGIIPGGSYSGDRLTANVNSGEMIINRRQQLQLWRMVQAPLASAPQYTTPSSMVPSLNLAALRNSFGAQRVDVNVSGRISGRDLQLISDKRNKITSRA
jgi:hypothetical protein